MKSMSNIYALLVPILMLILSGGVNARGVDTDIGEEEIIAPATDLHQHLAAVKSFQANFEQSSIDLNASASGNISDDAGRASKGQLWLSPGGKFKIETTSPYAQSLVSDGSSFWTYDEDLAQVIVSPLERDINKVPILLFGNTDSDLLNQYQISSYQSEDQTHFVLEPLGAESLFELITISFLDTVPVEITLLDSLGQKIRLGLQVQQMNEPISTQTYEFEVPKGVDVIDER